MKAIVGLGNVGEKYARTRHNVGFMVIEKLAPLVKDKKEIILFKPDTMMNASGAAVNKLVEGKKIKLSDLFIIHDDLDIRLGEYKIQRAKGPKVHKGVNSIESALGTSDFWRVRVGVDSRDPDNRTPGEEYVLQDFSDEEMETLGGVLDDLCKKLARL